MRVIVRTLVTSLTSTNMTMTNSGNSRKCCKTNWSRLFETANRTTFRDLNMASVFITFEKLTK